MSASRPLLLVAGEPRSVRDAWADALGASSCEIAGLPARLAADPSARALVFYLSPWEAFLDACEPAGGRGTDTAADALSRRWQETAQAVLDAASRWPDRVLMVNAGRLHASGQALVDVLSGAGWCPPASVPVASAIAPADPVLLARLFEEHAPAECDAYESLESMALLLGREAEFRGADARDVDLLGEALRVWGELAATRKEVDVARAASGRLQSERDALVARLESAEQARQAAEDALESRDALVAQQAGENELLLEHVVQLRQELAEQAQSLAAMRETAAQLGRAADAARALISG